MQAGTDLRELTIPMAAAAQVDGQGTGTAGRQDIQNAVHRPRHRHPAQNSGAIASRTSAGLGLAASTLSAVTRRNVDGGAIAGRARPDDASDYWATAGAAQLQVTTSGSSSPAPGNSRI